MPHPRLCETGARPLPNMPSRLRCRSDESQLTLPRNGLSLLLGKALAAGLLVLAAAPAAAVTVIVPDDWPTIQQAIDSGADTVLVRDGNYAEVPQAYRGVTLLGLGDRHPRLAGLAISNPYEW